MPISRLNYTDRKRISRKDVRILIHQRDGEVPTFDVELRLQEYELPADALVFVEAYRQTRWMRFPFGRVCSIAPPADRRLTEFESTDRILFRVRVTSASGRKGLILAEADQIPGRRNEQNEENRQPLLPVEPRDLGNLIWKLDFMDGPVLLINRSLDWRELACSQMFRSLVCPAALREVLTRILLHEDYPDLEDSTDWKTRWLLFGRSLPGTGEIPAEKEDQERFEEWIELVVEAFARQHSFLSVFLRVWQGESA